MAAAVRVSAVLLVSVAPGLAASPLELLAAARDAALREVAAVAALAADVAGSL